MKQRTFNVISAATNLDSLQVGLEPVLQNKVEQLWEDVLKKPG
ncbi:WSSV017 [White spot syndrome virus]|uniref:WSSV017 n=1 Tax=White spot syndrome virus TaxID=342409 RepID=A0A2I6SBF8_9VIRU|nr:WSSV017 [White spot syndrome virus]